MAVDQPPRQIAAARIEAFRWAPDADQLAWIAAGALHIAAARTASYEPRRLLGGWDLTSRLGWSDKSDGIIIAGTDPAGSSGVWMQPVDGGTPRRLLSTESKPSDLAVGGEGPWGGLGASEYKWLAAVVADGRVTAIGGSSGAREVTRGAYDTVAVDRLGENIAFGGPGGMGVSLYPSQPARPVIGDREARPAEFGYTSEWMLVWLGDIGSTLASMRPDGTALRPLIDSPRGYAFASSGREVLVGSPDLGVVLKSLGGGPGGSAGPTEPQPDRLLAPAGVDPTTWTYSPVAWSEPTSGGRILCLAPDLQSTTRHTIAAIADSVTTSRLRSRATGHHDSFGGNHLAGLVAVAAD